MSDVEPEKGNVIVEMTWKGCIACIPLLCACSGSISPGRQGTLDCLFITIVPKVLSNVFDSMA